MIHADHFVEVYGNKHIDVLIRDVPFVSTPRAEILVEEWLDLVLPIKYRQLHWPDLRRAAHCPRVTTPETIVETKARLNWLREIQSFDSTAAPSPAGEERKIWVA